MGTSAEGRLASLRALQAADVRLLDDLRARSARAKRDGHEEIRAAAEARINVVQQRTNQRMLDIGRLQDEIRRRPGGH